MKKILITGANSYIGTSFEKYMAQWPEKYQVDTVSLRGDAWREMSFAGYDAVYHVAGIAHIKETKENAHLYYKVNRDLTVNVAKKAKVDGVPQLVFLSTMAVYGIEEGIISQQTSPVPKSHYGKAKLEAEEEIQKLVSENFRVVVLRPPMIYGKGCKGNFQLMLKLVRKFPVFPLIKNQRSMLHIENLCAFVEHLISTNAQGLYCPQDREYMQTSQMAGWMAEGLGKKLRKSRFLGWLIAAARPYSTTVRKAFGTLIYQDRFDAAFCVLDTADAVRKSV